MITLVQPVQNACIALLEDLLEEAKAGRVTGFACAYTAYAGDVGSCYHGQSYASLLGAVEIMKAELLQEFLVSE